MLRDLARRGAEGFGDVPGQGPGRPHDATPAEPGTPETAPDRRGGRQRSRRPQPTPRNRDEARADVAAAPPPPWPLSSSSSDRDEQPDSASGRTEQDQGDVAVDFLMEVVAFGAGCLAGIRVDGSNVTLTFTEDSPRLGRDSGNPRDGLESPWAKTGRDQRPACTEHTLRTTRI